MEFKKRKFTIDSEGNLRKRTPANLSRVVRENYSKHHSTIKSVADLKATLRAGEYAWPGAYQLAFVTSDGGVLSFDSVREEFHQVVWSIRNGASDGWRVDSCIIVDDEGDPLYCDHSGEPIGTMACLSVSRQRKLSKYLLTDPDQCR